MDGQEKRDLLKKVSGLFINKLFAVSRNGIDSFCISAFIGLAMTGIYNNYLLILMGINAIFGVVSGSMIPSVGNSIVGKSRDENYADMRRFDFIYMAVSGWAVTCLFCMYQPFMRLWAGENMILGIPEVISLCTYFYIMRMGDIRWVYHEGAGLWWECRYIAVSEFVANVILNIALCKLWGVLGIIIATNLSLFFINYLGCPFILFRDYFRNSKLKKYFLDHLQYAITMIITVMVAWYLCKKVTASAGLDSLSLNESIVDLGIRLVISTVVAVILFMMIWSQSERYKESKRWISRTSILGR